MEALNWLLEYKATEAFGIPDVSPQSLHTLVESFEDPNSDNFRKYFLYNSVSAGGENCDDACKTGQICGITKIGFDEYDTCLKNGTATISTSTSATTETMSTIESATSGTVLKFFSCLARLLVMFVVGFSFEQS